MEYYSLNQYCRDVFGRKLYKIALDGGFTCPNRDGTLDTRGCIFCDGGGSGTFAQPGTMGITEQLERGKALVEAKLPKEEPHSYIAYFQNFTGTYAPVSRLRELYTEAIRHPEVAALSVATRPDCLGEEVIALLEEMNRSKPVWVELGLQTIHEETAAIIRRGYALPVYDDAVARLQGRVSEIITHVILGLPGESREMMLQTVRHVAGCGSTGIKLQLLHVLVGTDLAEQYRQGRVPVMSMEEYIQTVVDCLRELPEKMVVHRLTGDGAKRDLLAPLWSANKKRVLNAMRKAIAEAE